MASITVTLPDGSQRVAQVNSLTTLRQILVQIEAPIQNVYIYNIGNTLMPNLDRTLIDYNNWYVEKGYVPSFHMTTQNLGPFHS